MIERRDRMIIALQILWLALVMGLGFWWMSLLSRQAHRIAALQGELGVAADVIQGELTSTRRMVFWEGGTFLFFAALSGVLLLWLYLANRLRTKSLQGFFSSVTHELKTPLTSIRLQAESLQDELQGGHSAASVPLLTRLFEDTLRLEAQVERTLELARLEGGGAYHIRPLNLKSFTERTLGPWIDSLPEDVKVQIDIPSVDVLADPAALAVVLRNLMENAIRHGKKDKQKLLIDIHSTLDHKSGMVRLTFKDSGLGYSGMVARLGRLFHKGATSPGAGVGLYLVKTLIGRMGGTARFLPVHQGGFTVELSLPMAEEGHRP
jgi:signal transduction histidine kinase